MSVLVTLWMTSLFPIFSVLISNPLGATGIANIYEVSTHLREEAGERQVKGAKLGLTHVIGLGSACGIHILEKVN